MPLASVTAHWLAGWGEVVPDESGGAPGAYILNGSLRPRRRKKKKQVPEWFNVEIVMAPDVTVIIDEPLIDVIGARQRAEDELLLVGLL